MEITTFSTEETKKLASELAQKIKQGTVIALYGDLGSGKTTFTRFFVESLGLKVRVQSPTFVIERKYYDENSQIKTINHVDLYRLSSQEEVEDLGIGELLFEKDSVTLIEWPELIEDILPEDTVKIYFEYVGETARKIKIENID